MVITAMTTLTDIEFEIVSGGVKNADLPRVREALSGFYSTYTAAAPRSYRLPGRVGGGSFPNCSAA
jgi:hypothetical protein